MNSQVPKQQPGCSPRFLKWVLGIAVAITAVYVFTEHRVHVALVLPYLLLLACPLMHLFMHRGHGHRHDDEQSASTARNESPHSTHAGDSSRLS